MSQKRGLSFVLVAIALHNARWHNSLVYLRAVASLITVSGASHYGRVARIAESFTVRTGALLNLDKW
jgi:hypothetical protein